VFCIILASTLAYDLVTPLIESADIFLYIDRMSIRQCMATNREYRYRLAEFINMHPSNRIAQMALSDAKLLYEAWDALDDASSPTYTIGLRRNALAKLQAIIGTDAFDRGIMPFPLPEWELREVR
jgi:hypothetical protein